MASIKSVDLFNYHKWRVIVLNEISVDVYPIEILPLLKERYHRQQYLPLFHQKKNSICIFYCHVPTTILITCILGLSVNTAMLKSLVQTVSHTLQRFLRTGEDYLCYGRSMEYLLTSISYCLLLYTIFIIIMQYFQCPVIENQCAICPCFSTWQQYNLTGI